MATSSGSPTGDQKSTSPSHDIPVDPLLEPGSYIDTDPSTPKNGPVSANDDSIPNGDSIPDKKTSGADAAAVETPTWLPEGWKMSYKIRGSGATAGSIDRYYFDPKSETRFRSRKEVEYFLQTGSKKRKRDAADVQPSESPATGKKKKSGSGSGSKNVGSTPPPLKFDFDSVPEMTTWKLKDAANDQWMPFMDDKMVSKSIKHNWTAAFQSLASAPAGPI